jgi:hypothetical protein
MTDRDHDDYRQLQDERHKAVMDRLVDIHIAVTKQNGRVGELEAKVAVLEDRSPSRQGGIWGAVGGVVAGFAASWLKP